MTAQPTPTTSIRWREAWRERPDDETEVLIRTQCQETPLVLGYISGNGWFDQYGTPIFAKITAWMPLDPILDLPIP